MIASTEQTAAPAVPDCEGKIAEQMMDALIAPLMPGVKDEFRVSGAIEILRTVRRELCSKVVPGVDAAICGKPRIAIDRARLHFPLGLRCRAQQSMTETGFVRQPHVLPVGPAKSHRIGHALQQFCVDRGGMRHQSNDAAHKLPCEKLRIPSRFLAAKYDRAFALNPCMSLETFFSANVDADLNFRRIARSR
jgi:hypothetical protein